jgi:beta-lactam-binding protein with PASTA domain
VVEVAVPEVVGLSLRAVARVLHENGLRMQLSGWGMAASTDPEAGVLVPKGTVVRVVGELDSGGEP